MRDSRFGQRPRQLSRDRNLEVILSNKIKFGNLTQDARAIDLRIDMAVLWF